jgi:hypothetical protein
MTVVWDRVTRDDVVRAIGEYDRLGPEEFFSAHGFGPTTTYDLVWDERRYPPKAVLGTAYEFAPGPAPGLRRFRGREGRRRQGARKARIRRSAATATGMTAWS